ncbi:MAG: hypothetical protein PVJ57_01845 [Phycisphaerae bacterium]|jgi:hypothetical protein
MFSPEQCPDCAGVLQRRWRHNRCRSCGRVLRIRRRAPWPLRCIAALLVFIGGYRAVYCAFECIPWPDPAWFFGMRAEPFFAAMAILPLLLGVLVYHWLTFFDETHGDGRLHCPRCGHLLMHLTEPRCPECGWVI